MLGTVFHVVPDEAVRDCGWPPLGVFPLQLDINDAHTPVTHELDQRICATLGTTRLGADRNGRYASWDLQKRR